MDNVVLRPSSGMATHLEFAAKNNKCLDVKYSILIFCYRDNVVMKHTYQEHLISVTLYTPSTEPFLGVCLSPQMNMLLRFP